MLGCFESAEWLDFEDHHIARFCCDDGIDVSKASDALIRRHLNAKPRDAPAKLCHVGEIADWLLDIVEVEQFHVPNGVFRFVQCPGAIGIQSNPTGRAKGITNRSDSLDIVGQCGAGATHLDLHRGGHSCRGEEASDLLGRYSGDRSIDPNAGGRW